MKYYLAIDIGASSGRHLLGWVENGKILTEEIYRFQNLPKERITTFGGDIPHLTWDVKALYKEILNGLKKAAEIGKIPVSVGIDTWGVDYVLLDGEDKEIGEVYCYRDARTEKVTDLVHEKIPFEVLYEKTGIQFGTINTIYQLYSDKLSGKLDEAKTMLMLPDYFNYKLTGQKRHESTIASTTGMINTKTHTWDEEIIEALGFNKELFEPLSMPGTTVGEFTDEVAEFVGYKAKITLPATHDTGSAVVAAPLLEAAPYISSGTWSLLGIEKKDATTTETARVANYSNEGGAIGDFRLQKNIMGLWIIQQIRHELDDKYSFAELADMARESEVDYTIDVNDQRFLAPKSMIEEVTDAVGCELSTGEMAYVVFSSLAKSYKEAMADLEGITGEKYTTLNIIGGGSKNTLLNELTAKHTGRKIITGPSEGTAIGNLIMQMVGTGDLSGISEGRRLVKNSFEINEI